MTALNAICVYCGSNAGTRPEYAAAAKAMGEALARRGLTLVYGGGKVGLMGAVANAALAAGGRLVRRARDRWRKGHGSCRRKGRSRARLKAAPMPTERG